MTRPPASFRVVSTSRVESEILAALPPDEAVRLAPELEVVPLRLRDTLESAGERIAAVLFPAAGFCSMLTTFQDGGAVEVAAIGREGVVGVFAALSGGAALSTTIVQAEGSAYRMDLETFRREVHARGAFYELMIRYARTLAGSIMQVTACNAAHKLEHRLSRWLLMAHDRMGEDEFPLTQEFAAMMLGVTRPTVTTVAGTLQKAGLITYRRGRVRIVDREGLESASCECYLAIRGLFHPVTPRHPRG